MIRIPTPGMDGHRQSRSLLLLSLAGAVAAASLVQADQQQPRRGPPLPQRAEAARPPADRGRARRPPPSVPDNLADPWRTVPFNPDKFWEWQQRNAP